MALQKQYNIKFFDLDGSTLLYNVPPSFLANNPPVFRARINAGLGELPLDLALPWDNFSDGTYIKSDSIVEVWSVDTANTLGRRIYKGYVSRYGPHLDAGFMGLHVDCQGLGSIMTHSLYRSGASDTVSFTATDPTAMAEAIIDHLNTIEGGSLISYTHGTSTVATGTSLNKDFTDKYWFDAMNDVLKLCPTGYWWSVDANGLFSLKQKPSTATHRFTIGKDVEQLDALKDSELVANDLEVRYSGGTNPYSDSTSQHTYGHGAGTPSGKRTKILTDTTVTNSASADAFGNAYLASNKDAKVTTKVTVNSNYDIDLIKVGDTCSIFNFNVAFAYLPLNMQIVGLTYNGQSVDLELQNQQQDFGLELQSYVKG